MEKEDFQRLRERGWANALSPQEEAELAAELERQGVGRAERELEAAAQEAFRSLPKAEPSTNFTTQVIEAIDREEVADRRRRGWLAPLLLNIGSWRWMRPVVYASAVIVIGWMGYSHYKAEQRAATAKSLAQVTEIKRVPSVEALKDFEAIRHLGEAPSEVDVELLAALE